MRVTISLLKYKKQSFSTYFISSYSDEIIALALRIDSMVCIGLFLSIEHKHRHIWGKGFFFILSYNTSQSQFHLLPLFPISTHLPSPLDILLLLSPLEKSRPPRTINQTGHKNNNKTIHKPPI